MKVATARELSAGAAGDTGVDNSKHIDVDNTLDHISLDNKITKMTTDKDEQNNDAKKTCEVNDNDDELTRINNKLNNDNESLPFVIQNKEGVGNFVVASRDIKPNEVHNIKLKLQIVTKNILDHLGGLSSSAWTKL